MLPHLERAHEPSPRRWWPCRQHLQPEEREGLRAICLCLSVDAAGSDSMRTELREVGGARGRIAAIPTCTAWEAKSQRATREDGARACPVPARAVSMGAMAGRLPRTHARTHAGSSFPMQSARSSRAPRRCPSCLYGWGNWWRRRVRDWVLRPWRSSSPWAACLVHPGLSQSSVSSVLERRSQPPAPT